VPVLTSQQRRALEDACTKGRRAVEQAVRAALTSLAITADRPPAHLNEGERQLRRGLRAKSRQLGDTGNGLDLLIAECAYEQWHRLLFARFLAENSLLIHPEYHAPVTLEDCEELAEALGEPDGWSVAAGFAAEILPGIFRLDDPCVQLRLTPEGRLALEGILASLPAGVFAADDALGWVYQFWQKDKKDEVNASERKIGGADLGPVTQLFTENYMVRFLLENSLGSWWAARHPNSPLVNDFEYLRFDHEKPAAGTFDRWPGNAADITVMDPCCGSGHFLVEAFSMLWRMRAEEEGLAATDAQDAVLRDNLFGLELDPRCVQIAMFAVALQAWKAGGAWRALPVPNVACSGVPVRASVEEWKVLADGDVRLENALVRLHALFRDADTLGSLLDPERVTAATESAGLQISLDDVDWEKVAALLLQAAATERVDPARAVLGADARSIAVAADYLSRRYTLIATNVPWCKRGNQGETLRAWTDQYHAVGRGDIATTFMHRWLVRGPSLAAAIVSPEAWLTAGTFKAFRTWMLTAVGWEIAARLGTGAFEAISGEVVSPLLLIVSHDTTASTFCGLDVSPGTTAQEKAEALRADPLLTCDRASELANPDSRVIFAPMETSNAALLAEWADGLVGMQTSDDPRYKAWFWEVDSWGDTWERLQDVPESNAPWSGCTGIVRWEVGTGPLSEVSEAWKGRKAWGRQGVIVSRFGRFCASLYGGSKFHQNAAVILPADEALTAAILAYCQSDSFERDVRKIDHGMKVTNATLVKVPFDIAHWRDVAQKAGPLPTPWSDDPRQWVFDGRPAGSVEPLHVGVARLVGYRWPEQAAADHLAGFSDGDGIVCLPSVVSEPRASDRLEQLLSAEFGQTWSPAKQQALLTNTGSNKRNVADWLRDDFFRQHCALFSNRPFIWHIWDGQRDGFAALLNYHWLNGKTLEKLTYTYLGDWIERQRAEVRDGKAGAEARLTAALKLRGALESILEGEPPFDIYVRWKSLAEQSIGWHPDVDDGVRLNVRPFVEAGVLRSSFNVQWRKDRGKDPDGTVRLNDLHFTIAEKRAARRDRSE
jgi:hypothetical protein